MTNEELILARLDSIEAKITPLIETANAAKELKEDLTPLVNSGIQQLVTELQDIESSVQLEDLLDLGKGMLKSTRYIIFALKQLENVIDFYNTVEPLLRSSVPQIIAYLDDLEQKGVLRIIKSMLDVRAKVAATYSPEDVEQIGDGMVSMLGLAKKMSDPKTVALLDKFTSLPANLDLTQAKPRGPIGMLTACGSPEVKQGLGVLIELTKALGTVKDDVAAIEPPATMA